ncbi:MAG: hypothetical protein JWM50_1196 [Microbacteriaceae bacterium]|jgi:hypothetical protein|nr:hypothetical protein [Microbacteriaceae bacterium]
MSARAKDLKLVLGGSPRVRLLPPEVADRKRAAAVRRSVIITVIGALVLCAGAYSFATWRALEAAIRFDDAQLQTSSLLKQQSEYTDARTLSDQLSAIGDAQRVGTLTEIEWKAFYERVVSTLPAGMTLDSFTLQSGTPVASLVEESEVGVTIPAAETSFISLTRDLESAQTWVVALKSLPEFGDALATAITRDDDGVYSVSVAMRLTEAARTERFAQETEETPAPDAAVQTEEGSG